jgi:hypothetical protein
LIFSLCLGEGGNDWVNICWRSKVKFEIYLVQPLREFLDLLFLELIDFFISFFIFCLKVVELINHSINYLFGLHCLFVSFLNWRLFFILNFLFCLFSNFDLDGILFIHDIFGLHAFLRVLIDHFWVTCEKIETLSFWYFY